MSTENLFGVPHAETLHDNPAAVWETDIEEWVDYHDEREWVIEEYTSKGPESFMLSADTVAATIAEHSADEMGMESAADAWDEASRDPSVLKELDKVIRFMAGKVHYRLADEKVAEHKVTIGANGEPLLNGVPMYRKTGGLS